MRGLRAYLKNDSRKGHASCPCDAILSWPPKSSLEAGYTHLTDGETEAKNLSSSKCILCSSESTFFLSLDFTGYSLLCLQIGKQSFSPKEGAISPGSPAADVYMVQCIPSDSDSPMTWD